jgi:hypothetical protein
MRLLLIASIIICASFSDAAYAWTSCSDLRQMAEDKAKIAYLEAWIDAKIADRDFLRAEGTGAFAQWIARPETFSNFGLDLSRIDVDPRFAGIMVSWDSFESLDSYLDWDSGNPELTFDPKRIAAVVIQEGRDMLFIKVNGSKDLGELFSLYKHIVSVSDRVSIWCGSDGQGPD